MNSMKKQWVKHADFNYSLWVQDKEIGRMDIHFNTVASEAICTIDGKILQIKRTGFWKSGLEIADSNNNIVLKAYPENWYANTSIIEVENKTYKLIIRNNPLAEFAITENGKNVIAYGLDIENGRVKLRITKSGNDIPIFDFLLWYLFLPIANENSGDSYSFIVSPAV